MTREGVAGDSFGSTVSGSARSLGRRGFLRAVGAMSIAGISGPALAACSGGGGAEPEPSPSGQAAVDLSTVDMTVTISNWPYYIDYTAPGSTQIPPPLPKPEPGESISIDSKTRPTLQRFQLLNGGIEPRYWEDITDNVAFAESIRPALENETDTGRDLIVLTDWMARRFIDRKWAQKLEHAFMTNIQYLRPELQNADWDLQRDYAVPYQSGVTGIAYNSKLVDTPIRTVRQLLTAPALRGKVGLLTEMRDTVGMVLLDRGIDPARVTDAQFETAIDVLNATVRSGQLGAVSGNTYVDWLANGTIAACLAWSGDILQLQRKNPAIKFVVPEPGAMFWTDNMMVPNKAQHKANAEKFIHFVYSPFTAARITLATRFVSPVPAAKDGVAKDDPALAKNPLVFPSAADFAQWSTFKTLPETTEAAYEKKFKAFVVAAQAGIQKRSS